MEDKNDNYVIAFFDSKKSAEKAIEALKKWDKTTDSIKLGQIAVLERDGDEIKADLGSHAKQAAAAGALAGALLGALSKKHSVVGSAAMGTLAGGVVGKFIKEKLKLSDAEMEQLRTNLSANGAAVVMFCDAHEMSDVEAQIKTLGGTTQEITTPAGAAAEVVADSAFDFNELFK